MNERARSVVGLLTSLGLAVPATTAAGCTNPVPPTDAGPVVSWNDGWGYDAGMDAGAPDAPIDASAIGNEGWIDSPIDAAEPDPDDAATDDDAPAGDDDAGTAG